MTDQELKEAFESMPREDFKELLRAHQLVLVPDGRGISGYGCSHAGDTMYYVESLWSVPVRDKRTPLWVG